MKAGVDPPPSQDKYFKYVLIKCMLKVGVGNSTSRVL